MSGLPQLLGRAGNRSRSAVGVSLFLEFDGALVPIGCDPAAPMLPSGAAQTLREISSQEFLDATVISGRSAGDRLSDPSGIHEFLHWLASCKTDAGERA